MNFHAAQSGGVIGQPLALALAVSNSIMKEEMTLSAAFPVPTGASLALSGEGAPCAGQCYKTYPVIPGEQASISLEMTATQPGEYTVEARLKWFFGDDKTAVSSRTETVTLRVREPEAAGAPVAGTAPTAENAAFFRAGPTVRLRPLNDVVDQNSDGLVEVLFRNPALNDTAMMSDLSVSLPSGFHIYGDGFATDTAAGTASGSFETLPGQSKTIFLNIKAEKVGTADIHFSGVYWPKGNKDLHRPVSLTHPFTVNAASPDPFSDSPTEASAPAPTSPPPTSPPPAQEPAPGAGCSFSPAGGARGAGDLALLSLPILGLCLAARRRHRNAAALRSRSQSLQQRFERFPGSNGRDG